jgi:membrane-associated phospholipid phosphatase
VLSRRPWRIWTAYTVLVGSLYILATRAPYREPIVIPPITIDGFIPFVPAAALVYATYAVLFPALIAAGRRTRGFDQVFAVAMGCGFANAIVYNVVPTRIPDRTLAPAASVLALVQRLDTRLGAFPSGHVALPAAIATTSLLVASRSHGDAARFWRRSALAFAVWTAALAASTVLTKQHVVVDIVAGLAFGMGAARVGTWAFRRLEVAAGGAA